MFTNLLSLRCALASCGAVYCSQSCLCVCDNGRAGGRAGGRAVSAPYYSQRARSVCVSLSAFFHSHLCSPTIVISFWDSIFFYRATLCVSALFTVARCPSVTFVYCIQRAEHMARLLSRPDSPSFYFLVHASIPTSKGNPIIGDAKYTDGGEKCALWLVSPFISERYETGPWSG